MAVPEILWHYTDAGGLHGIVSSGLLRLTDVRFLNDRTERTYGSGVVRTHFDALLRNRELDAKIIDPEYAGYRVAGQRQYICSFTEQSDSLSQWQRYAADGSGYCIGLDPRALLGGSDVEDVDFRLPALTQQTALYDPDIKEFREVVGPPVLRKMIYDGDEQANKTRLCVRAVLSRTGSVEEAARYMNLALDQVAVQFKNPLFEDEQEWRLIQEAYQDSSRSLVRFATRGSYVRPYLETRGSGEHAMSRLPIRAITCGPRLDDDIAIEAVQELLSANGYSVYEIDVQVSRLRGTWR